MIAFLARKPVLSPASDAKDTDLGTVLLDAGFIDTAQLLAAVHRQNHSVPRPRLGEVIVRMGLCSQLQVNAALKIQEHHRNGDPAAAKREKSAAMLEAQVAAK